MYRAIQLTLPRTWLWLCFISPDIKCNNNCAIHVTVLLSSLEPILSEFILFHITDRFLEFNIDVLHCCIILIPIWTEHSAVLLCHFDVYSMIISKLILAKFSLTSHLSYNRQTFGILLNNCLCIMVLISICHCLVRVYARVFVWGWACVSVFVCLFCMPCVERVWMFFVLLFYVIYSRTIASIANVFCWLYPTLNKVYLIYLILSYQPPS